MKGNHKMSSKQQPADLMDYINETKVSTIYFKRQQAVQAESAELTRTKGLLKTKDLKVAAGPVTVTPRKK